jgi:hypothetical protein
LDKEQDPIKKLAISSDGLTKWVESWAAQGVTH